MSTVTGTGSIDWAAVARTENLQNEVAYALSNKSSPIGLPVDLDGYAAAIRSATDSFGAKTRQEAQAFANGTADDNRSHFAQRLALDTALTAGKLAAQVGQGGRGIAALNFALLTGTRAAGTYDQSVPCTWTAMTPSQLQDAVTGAFATGRSTVGLPTSLVAYPEFIKQVWNANSQITDQQVAAMADGLKARKTLSQVAVGIEPVAQLLRLMFVATTVVDMRRDEPGAEAFFDAYFDLCGNFGALELDIQRRAAAFRATERLNS